MDHTYTCTGTFASNQGPALTVVKFSVIISAYTCNRYKPPYHRSLRGIAFGGTPFYAEYRTILGVKIIIIMPLI